jgi:hypothetical protein
MRRKPTLLLLAVAACVAALAVVVGSASAAKTHIFKEVFGSSAQPTFTSPRGMAIDQGSGEVYVIDAGSPPSIKRYNADGTASNFSALASNVIDGAGGADTTPQGSLVFGTATRVQIALDESGGVTDGDIYVAQASTKLVDVFDSTGTYKGQLTESSEGLLGEICGVAVDSAGALYLGDIGGKVRKYVPAANPPVKADNTANFTTVAAPCQIAAGTGATAGFIFVNRSTGELKKVDSATGEVKYAIGSTTHRTVYVNPASGHVYAPRQTGSSSEVVEYDASGAGSATTVSSVKPGSTIEGIAVRESTGDVYLTRSGQTTVQVYGPTVTVPDVVTSPVSNNTGTRATLNGTVNPDGVELSECFFEWGQGSGATAYTETTPCAETPAAIGTGTSPVAVHADVTGLAPQGVASGNSAGDYHYRLVAKNPNATVNGSNQNFETPITVIAEAASGSTPTEVTLNGSVNPDTATISECVFEWAEQVPFEEFENLAETAPCVPGPGGITGESPVAVQADLSGLHPGTAYAYRLRVAYPTGTIVHPKLVAFGGAALLAQTLGPAIGEVRSEDVTSAEATLKADVNPEGKETTYRFEWGPTTAYGSETPEASAGSGGSDKEVTAFLDGLEAGTVYHYRLVATNEDATNEGADHTFVTYARPVNEVDCPNQSFRTGASAALPDCRAFEMVSPVDKEGQEIFTRPEPYGDLNQEPATPWQSSVDGDKVTYGSFRAFGDQPGASANSQNLSTRGPDGWSTEGINPPAEDGAVCLGCEEFDYKAFSPDLSLGWLFPLSGLPLAPGATPGEVNLYRRDNATRTYTTLIPAEPNVSSQWFPEYSGSSADGEYVVFRLNDKITPEAATGFLNGSGSGAGQLYMWHDGEVHSASILPSGEASSVSSQLGSRAGSFGTIEGHENNVTNAISDDGRRIFWTAITKEVGSLGPIYMREHAEQGVVAGECVEAGKACTIPVSGSVTPEAARYWTASADGARVLFSYGGQFAHQNLYLFDVDTETPTLIANSALGVAGASEDLSRIYFASSADLAPGATAGRPNLYRYDEGAVTFIAPLSATDANPHSDPVSAGDGMSVTSATPGQRNAAVTADGAHLAFVANSRELAQQVGYDNVETSLGEPAAEVYLYDAGSDEVVCASCNPSGARPEGEARGVATAAWMAPHGLQYYARRFVSDDGGRVFFNSYDALVPADSNGLQDVYQWEAPGSGDCSEASSAYSPLNKGCVSLISGGQSPAVSSFVDASLSGDDVFLQTRSSLVAKDIGSWDIYDARVGGGLPQPASASECVGDACQSVPEPPRFPSHASAAFRGAGDPRPLANCGAQARRAVRLARRAKRLRRAASRAATVRRGKQLQRRSSRLAKQARRLSAGAKRCRRASRRADR